MIDSWTRMVSEKLKQENADAAVKNDVSGGPVVKTLCFHCSRHGFNHSLGNYNTSHLVQPKHFF